MAEEGILVWIGDDEEREVNGNIGVFDQVLYPGSLDSFERQGERIGSAHGFYVVTPKGRAICHVTLEFDDQGSLNAGGTLDHDDGIRDGVLGVTGGTGRFRGRTGRLGVDVMNPKRYRLDSGG